MKIVIINEKYKLGGAEMQTHREASILRDKGHNVLVITLDSRIKDGEISSNLYNIKDDYGFLSKQYYKIFTNKKIKHRIESLIEQFSPDIIRLNNTLEHLPTILNAVKDYPCVQTVRDYGSVCPNGLSIHQNLNVCSGYKGIGCCYKNCYKGRAVRLLWKWLLFRRGLSLRKRIVNYFICPSKKLTEYLANMGLKVTCINNPFDASYFKHMKKLKVSQKKYLYYGLVAPHKGVLQLIDAFKLFAENKHDVELNIVGDIVDDNNFREDFFSRLKDNENIAYYPRMEYVDMLESVRDSYAVVVPSVWMENYPNTALEARALGCLVLASDRGGMREIVNDERFIFDVINIKDIIDKLENAYNLPWEDYLEYTNSGIMCIEGNNSMEKYYRRLMDLIIRVV